MNLTESFKEDSGMMLYFVKKSPGDPSKEMEDAYSTAIETMGVDSLVKWIEKSEECLDMPKAKLSRCTSVFVFEEFAGPAFEYISNSRESLILGPRCVLACYLGNLSIPRKFGCVMNFALRGCCITGSGMPREDKISLKKFIHYMGGDYIDELTEHCTHLVTITVMSNKYLEAGKRKLPILHIDWINDVWHKSFKENIVGTSSEFDKFKLPIFFNLNVTSSGLSVADRNNVKQLIESNGGKYHGSFKSEIVNVLIVDKSNTDSLKFKAAVRFKKHCLTVDYVLDSVEQGYALETPMYEVVAPAGIKVSTPNKTINPDFNGDSICNLSRISNVSQKNNNDIDETAVNIRNSIVPQLTYKQQMEKINISDAKRAGLFLDGCNIYLSGFNSEENILLNKVLNSGGATRYDEINDQVTHVLVGQLGGSDLNAIQDNPELSVITVEWLNASILLKHMAPVEKFLVSKLKKTIVSSDHPSPASKKTIQSMNNTFKRPQAPKLNLDNTTSKKPRVLSHEFDAENSLVEQYLEEKEVDQIKIVPSDPPKKAPANANKSANRSIRPIQGNPALTDCSVEFNFLEKKTIYLHDFNEDDKLALISDCVKFGGNIVDSKYDRVVDYCIAPALGYSTPKIPVNYKHFVNNFWVEACMKVNLCVEDLYYYKPFLDLAPNEKCLMGENLVVSNYKEDERGYIFILGAALGGNISDVFRKADNPILITPLPVGAKYTGAINWKLPVISVQWLVECYNKKRRVNERPFLVGDSITSRVNIEEEENDLEGSHNSMMSPPHLDDSNVSKQDKSFTSKKSTSNDESSDEEQPVKPQMMATESPLIRPKRVTELNPTTPIWKFASPRANTASTSPASPVTPQFNFDRGHNISDLTKDMPSPQRHITYDALKEAYESESSQARRLKVLCETPLAATNFKNSPMPALPECMQTPKENLSFWPDASPESQIYHKRKFEVLDMYYLPDSESTKKKYAPKPVQPSQEERRRFFWQHVLGDKYDSPGTELSTQALMRNDDSKSEDEEPFSKGSAKSLNFNDENNRSENVDSPNVQKLTDFLKKRTEEKERKASIDLLQKPLHLEHQLNDGPSSSHHYDSDGILSEDVLVGWRDPSEHEPKRFKSQRKMFEKNPVFVISSINIENLEQITEQIEQLNGKVEKRNAQFPSSCTHLITDNPGRAQKFLSAVACGRYSVHSDYIAESFKVGYFLNEEDYEWGNPVNDYKHSESIYKSSYIWRLKIKNEPEFKNGAFTQFKIILKLKESKANTASAIMNIIKIGGGVAFDSSKTIIKTDWLMKNKVTHCFSDKNMLTETEASNLKSLKIPVLDGHYVYTHLLNE